MKELKDLKGYTYLIDPVTKEMGLRLAMISMLGDSDYKETRTQKRFSDVTQDVRNRLQKWQNYHEHNSCSTPGSPYGVADEVADAIYQARKISTPMSINKPDPELNLNVSDESILTAMDLAKSKETSGLVKYLF